MLHSHSLPYTYWSDRNVANLLQVLPPVKVQNKGQNLYSSIRQPDIKVSAAIHACNIPGLSTLLSDAKAEAHIYHCTWPVLRITNQKC